MRHSIIIDHIEDYGFLAEHFNLERERFDFHDKPISKNEYKKISDFLECIEYIDSTTMDNEKPLVTYIIERGSVEQAINDFKDAYQGAWDSELEFATDLITDCYDLENIMGNLQYYFDCEKYAYDRFISDYSYIDGYVFRNI